MKTNAGPATPRKIECKEGDGMPGNAIQEFVIKLSAQVDNSGISQMMSLLDSNKLKALGVTAALSAATTAIYKFIKSATETEIELTALAKKQNKTIEATRAQETALKAMGKTLNEVKKDKALQEIYNDLVKVNKAMALPDMKGVITNVRNLQGSFWELKSTVNYAVQWIYAKVMKSLEEPINRITAKLHDISNWVQKNFQSITTKISSFITGFAKGIIGIVESFTKIVEWVDALPEGIKRIGTAVGVLWALIKSGPIGQIMTAISMIGAIIDDYEVWQYNQEHGTNRGTVLDSLWESIQPFLESGDIVGVIDGVVVKLTEALDNLTEQLSGIDLKGFLGDPGGALGDLVDRMVAWFDGDGQQKLESLGGALWRFVEAALGFGGGVTANLAGMLVKVFTPDDLDSEVDKALTNNNIAAGAGTGLLLKLLGVGDIGSIAGALITSLTNARKQANDELKADEDKAFATYGTKNPDEIAAKILGIDAAKLGQGIIGLIVAGIGMVDDIGAMIYGVIGEALGKDTDAGKIAAQLAGKDGKGSILGDALFNGILGQVTTGSFIGALAGFFGTIAASLTQPGGRDQLTAELTELGNNIANVLFGPLADDGKTRTGGLLQAIGTAFSSLWETLSPILEPLWTDISTAVTTFLDDTLTPIVTNWIGTLIGAITGIMPAWLKNLFGISDGNASVTENPDGTSTVTTADGKKFTGKKQRAMGVEGRGERSDVLGINTQEGGLVPKGFNKKVDEVLGQTFHESDKIAIQAFAPMYAQALADAYENWGDEAYNELYGIYNPEEELNYASIMRMRKELSDVVLKNGVNPLASYLGMTPEDYVAFEQGSSYFASAFGNALTYSDETQSTEMLTAVFKNLIKEAKENGAALDENKASLGGFLEACSKCTTGLSELVDTINNLNLNPGGGSEGGEGGDAPSKPNAWGGRIGGRMDNMTIGEDGTEYIIPVTKPDRAYDLIMQMLGEMGTSTINRVAAGLGLGESGTIGATMDSIAASLGNMNMSNSVTISAPVSIVINSTSADAESIGTYAYNAAERHLLRNLREVYT